MFFSKVVRYLLLPFSLLYGTITAIRNGLYNNQVLKSTKFKIPIICVGNLSVGGTGKTPQIEYLIRLLATSYKTAVLSRGYKRKSKGFVLANSQTTVRDLGDEPYQYFQKFNEIDVAVNNNRVEGVYQILEQLPSTELVLLDDAYQHRKIKAGLQILLTSYHNLYSDDFMMPTGRLREFKAGKKRAQIIVVTKCPVDLSKKEQKHIRHKLKPNSHQSLFFTKIRYSKQLISKQNTMALEKIDRPIVLVTGIANPTPLTTYLRSLGISFEHLKFSDHHNFSVKELGDIHEKSITHLVLTTEKDYVRLCDEITNLYYLPIEIEFLDSKEQFDQLITSFVENFR
ncbi:tetraacyldisaccharide 4'-kinase [Ochrovirga pacifica]|uniref:tetraacyldisaccharide 4'-kinase n=1 Tax=Ochrovirga pacifica TaxID=1042376 RepID=UPI0002F0AD07|nr:tetraacyldisaccharide 4'-kinase [Ochrovirga pacifica]